MMIDEEKPHSLASYDLRVAATASSIEDRGGAVRQDRSDGVTE